MAESEGSVLSSQVLSAYVLPGRTLDPGRIILEAQAARAAGLGGVWISERFALKEPAVLSGMVAASVPGLRIGGTMYAHMRHPVVTASVANLMQALTGDKFILVLARAVPAYFTGYDVPALTFERLRDYVALFRSLIAGERIDYEGPLGTFANLKLTDRHEGPPPPIMFTAVGPKALAFAGRHCDGVLLHPLLTTQAVARSAAIVRDAAREAGRDPAAVRVVANVVVAPDLPKDEEAAVIGGRAVTYLQSKAMGPLLAGVNGWDIGAVENLRSHPSIARFAGRSISEELMRNELVEASQAIPAEWLDQGTAAGTAVHVAGRLCEYLAAGADEILLHGSTPDRLGGLVPALSEMLPACMAQMGRGISGEVS
ncbi:TIGR03857 family LLM class F420-dependent oxidoreductase [Sphingobium baderi]|uniref:LLM class F420-dependent oxidoreductase n=1 Tax=Sphingobium baderi TaxID=1332080 RepID=A0A0S3EY72_9SPHN|nr:TIGR03857 family LLM class F420-dependent oxidoreductase [Sphingobium baderi]ALR20404.1 LLM class F420-dependent oxidoreductase [Sphingobium baderi]